MKRIIALTLALVLALSFVACSSANSDVTSDSATPEVENATPESEDATPELDDDMGVAPEGDTEATTAANLYADIISNARSAEESEAFMVIYPDGNGGVLAIDGFSADYEVEYLNEDVTNFMAPMLGFDLTLAEDYAFSISTMMTQSYGYAIVMPTEGNTDAVVAGLESFVAQQRSTFENYLPDQYEIANAATVTVASTGEVILACGPDSASILANIESALAA
ncbi:MAG: DUF4358 domain-containing protein [Faecalibacterium sp.]